MAVLVFRSLLFRIFHSGFGVCGSTALGIIACFLNQGDVYFNMPIHHKTIKEFGSVLIRFGEASVIGGVATFFVKDFPLWASFVGFGGGIIFLFSGLYFVNKSNLEEK